MKVVKLGFPGILTTNAPAQSPGDLILGFYWDYFEVGNGTCSVQLHDHGAWTSTRTIDPWIERRARYYIARRAEP